MTVQRLSDKAINRLQTHSIAEVERYIDEQLPLPTCKQEQQNVIWKREQVKMNVAASMRSTKVTGPTQYK